MINNFKKHLTLILMLVLAISLGSPILADNNEELTLTKSAKKVDGKPCCREYEVTLEIDGNIPKPKPVDVMFVVDRSEKSTSSLVRERSTLFQDLNDPNYFRQYYVNVGEEELTPVYEDVVTGLGGVYYYQLEGQSKRYVYLTGHDYVPDSDTKPGGSSSNSHVLKPFFYYTTEFESGSRLNQNSRDAMIEFTNRVNSVEESRVGLVTFGGLRTYSDASANGSLSDADIKRILNNNSLEAEINIIGQDGTKEASNIEAGLKKGLNALENSDNKKVVILITTGLPDIAINQQFSNINFQSGYSGNYLFSHTYNETNNVYKNSNVDLYTIGLFNGTVESESDLATELLENLVSINTGGNNEFFADEDGESFNQILEEIYNNIIQETNYYAKETIIKDQIKDDFIEPYDISDGGTFNPSTHEITWNLGDLDENKTLTYTIRATDAFTGGKLFPENLDHANIVYEDPIDGISSTRNFTFANYNVPGFLKLELEDEIEIILGEEVELGSNLNVIGGKEPYTYSWKENDSNWKSNDENPKVSPTEDTTYILTLTDGLGCKISKAILVKVKPLTITITKYVTGNFSDNNDKFDFNWWIDDVKQDEFNLSNNKTVQLEVSKGITLKLKELHKDYEVSYEVDGQVFDHVQGLIEIKDIDKDLNIIITNTRTAHIDTGISLDNLPYVFLISISILGIGYVLINRRKKY